MRLMLRPTDGPLAVRKVWGTGIAAVMTLAVIPYPIAAFVTADEEPHRIHNIVGALQYLPLWALPVALLTWRRDVDGGWRIALVSSVAMFAVGVWSGDLVASLSWMPLLTLVPMRPGGTRWITRVDGWLVVAAALALVVTIRQAPTLVDYQRLGLTDSHSLRFHFSAMAAAYVAITGTLFVAALHPPARLLHSAIAATATIAGVASLVWPFSESSLPRADAIVLTCAGILAAASTVRSVAR